MIDENMKENFFTCKLRERKRETERKKIVTGKKKIVTIEKKRLKEKRKKD